MRLVSIRKDRAQVEITQMEAVMLNNVLNEVLHALDPIDYHPRLGGTEEELGRLLKEFGRLATKLG